jgi:hypothetical protein
MSAIVTFRTTNPAGWDAVSAGALVTRPGGEVDPTWHAFLVDTYDFLSDSFVASNSWGRESGSGGQVRFRFEALHSFVITKVFFTVASIAGKTKWPYREVIQRVPGTLHGVAIDCARVNRAAALYSSDWVCDSGSSTDPRFQLPFSAEARGLGSVTKEDIADKRTGFIAYDLRQYIDAKLRAASAELARRVAAVSSVQSRIAARLTSSRGGEPEGGGKAPAETEEEVG